MKNKSKTIKRIIILILAIGIILFVALKFLKPPRDLSLANANIVEVRKGEITFKHELDGFVETEKEVLIFPSVNGTVKKVYHRLGDTVKKDEVLAELDSSGISEIRSNIEKLKISLNEKAKMYQNSKEIYNAGGISKQELNKFFNEYRLAQIDYENAILNSKDFDSKIISPVDGVIINASIDENLKIDRSKQLYTIVDVENLKIISEIPNPKLSSLKIDSPVYITSETLGDKVIEEKVTSIAKISEYSKKYGDVITKFTVKLKKDSGLKPGDNVKINIEYDKVENELIVPMSFVEVNGTENYVYALDKNNTIKKVPVKLGKNNNIDVAIKGDLKPGDKIVNNILKVYSEGDTLR